MANPPQWQGKQLQLHGFVVANSILVKPDTLEYKFKVQSNGQVMDAPYKGIVPDTFKDRPGEEAEVVLKGKLTLAGLPRGLRTASWRSAPRSTRRPKKVG